VPHLWLFHEQFETARDAGCVLLIYHKKYKAGFLLDIQATAQGRYTAVLYCEGDPDRDGEGQGEHRLDLETILQYFIIQTTGQISEDQLPAEAKNCLSALAPEARPPSPAPQTAWKEPADWGFSDDEWFDSSDDEDWEPNWEYTEEEEPEDETPPPAAPDPEVLDAKERYDHMLAMAQEVEPAMTDLQLSV